jgi:hypothetical protein
MPRPGEFYDYATGGKLEIDLRSSRPGQFKLLRKFAYIDPKFPNDPFIVPRDLSNWETDLASIPRYFTWLIPGLGVHLPAILLHDGLVVDDKNAIEHDGPPVSREEADRILRDAMRELKTPLVRRWLIWTAVVMATAWLDLKPAWRWRGLWLATIGTILALGSIATLDLFDIWNVLPWMGERVWWQELLLGGAFAVLIPLLFSILWGRLRIAAAILGVAFALLIHVTITIAGLYAAYEVLEWLAHRFDDARFDPTTATEVTPTGVGVGSTLEGD